MLILFYTFSKKISKSTSLYKKNNDDKINFILLRNIGKTALPNKSKISISDLKKKQITRKTDLIGFLFLCERLFSGKTNLFNFSNLKNDKWLEDYTMIKNNVFFKLNFRHIYKLVRFKYRSQNSN